MIETNVETDEISFCLAFIGEFDSQKPLIFFWLKTLKYVKKKLDKKVYSLALIMRLIGKENVTKNYSIFT